MAALAAAAAAVDAIKSPRGRALMFCGACRTAGTAANVAKHRQSDGHAAAVAACGGATESDETRASRHAKRQRRCGECDTRISSSNWGKHMATTKHLAAAAAAAAAAAGASDYA